MPTNKSYKKYTIIATFLGVYAILIIALLGWLLKGSISTSEIVEKFQSPAIIILAIVISVLTFTLASAVFSAIGKSNDKQALGLPDGSIRALIALTLITLFFILATQIYSKVSAGSIGKLENMTEESLKDLSVKDIISKTRDSVINPSYNDTIKTPIVPKFLYRYNVSVKVAPNSDASDMAKNIIASFTALIASICGFYFGSAASKQSVIPPDNTIKPKIMPKDPFPSEGTVGNTLTFVWTVSPSNEPIGVELSGDTAQPVPDATNPLKFTYTPTVTGTMTLKAHLKNYSSIVNVSKIIIS